MERVPHVGPQAASSRQPELPGQTELGIIYELGSFLEAVFKTFASDAADETRYGATPSQLRILQLLALRPGIRVTEVARGLAITRASACTALGRLASRGWVKRYPDRTDGRCRHVDLTTAGHAVVREFEAMQIGRLRGLLTQFSKSELDDFLTMVRRITSAIGQLYG